MSSFDKNCLHDEKLKTIEALRSLKLLTSSAAMWARLQSIIKQNPAFLRKEKSPKIQALTTLAFNMQLLHFSSCECHPLHETCSNFLHKRQSSGSSPACWHVAKACTVAQPLHDIQSKQNKLSSRRHSNYSKNENPRNNLFARSCTELQLLWDRTCFKFLPCKA